MDTALKLPAYPANPRTVAFKRLRSHIHPVEAKSYSAQVERIERLKKDKNAVILGHNYMTPEVFYGVADFVGDSLALAQQAANTDADVIVMAGVFFMAETAKLLNPGKTVLIPDVRAGCSLAESITAADVQQLKRQYPDVPVVTYVNTSAAVKAEADICCTSGNAVEIVESLGAPRVIVLPDEYLAHWIAGQTRVEIISWQGHCEVHERFTGRDIQLLREDHPGVVVLAHPECPPEVLNEADYVGSTSQMDRYVTERQPSRVALITECSMSDNVAANHPTLEFVRPCTLCPHMKRITLDAIEQSLLNLQHEVEVPPTIAERAARAVERMLQVRVP